MKERLLKLVNDNPNLQVSFLLGEESPYTECSKCWSNEMQGHSNLAKFVVEESGHHPNVENPERVVELIYKHVYVY